MVDEIEVDLEAARAVRHRRGREPARGHIERHLPPVIDQRRLRQADLADHLRPKLQRRAGVAPFGEGQARPDFLALCRRHLASPGKLDPRPRHSVPGRPEAIDLCPAKRIDASRSGLDNPAMPARSLRALARALPRPRNPAEPPRRRLCPGGPPARRQRHHPLPRPLFRRGARGHPADPGADRRRRPLPLPTGRHRLQQPRRAAARGMPWLLSRIHRAHAELARPRGAASRDRRWSGPITPTITTAASGASDERPRPLRPRLDRAGAPRGTGAPGSRLGRVQRRRHLRWPGPAQGPGQSPRLPGLSCAGKSTSSRRPLRKPSKSI